MRHMARHTQSGHASRSRPASPLAEIERVARVESISLNKAVAKIWKIGAGIDAAPDSRRIGAAVDRFVGKLSAAEARKSMPSLRVLEQVDDELWK